MLNIETNINNFIGSLKTFIEDEECIWTKGNSQASFSLSSLHMHGGRRQKSPATWIVWFLVLRDCGVLVFLLVPLYLITWMLTYDKHTDNPVLGFSLITFLLTSRSETFYILLIFLVFCVCVCEKTSFRTKCIAERVMHDYFLRRKRGFIFSSLSL